MRAVLLGTALSASLCTQAGAQSAPSFTVGACVMAEGNSGTTVCNFPVTIAAGAQVPLALNFHTDSPGNLLAPASDSSFEVPAVGSESWIFDTGSTLGAWTVESGNVELKSWRNLQAAHLRQSLDMHGDRPGSIARNIVTQSGQRYVVSFALAGNPNCALRLTTLTASFGGQSLGDFSFDSSAFSTANMGWRYHAVEVTAATGTSLLRFASTTAGGCGPAIDDVSVAPVGVASSGVDFQPAYRHHEDPVSIPVGVTTYTIGVNIIGDTTVEPLEDFQLRVCLANGECKVAVGGIQNDDSASDDPNYTAIYYAPANAGYGVGVTHQDQTVVAIWYTYDPAGRPVWYTAAAPRAADGRYRGQYFLSSGTPMTQIAGSPAVSTTVAQGSVDLGFGSNRQLDFAFTPNAGATQRRSLEPLSLASTPQICRFASGSTAALSNYSDLWWTPAENGWGLSVQHQGELMFLAWYTYAADRQPQWLTSVVRRQADGIYRGRLNRSLSGMPYTTPPTGAVTAFPVPEVGDVSLSFTVAQTGQFRYTVDGVSHTKVIERLVFGTRVQVCD